MASDLTGFNLDPNVKENTGGFQVIPEGIYKAVIVKDELKDNSKNTGKYLKLYLQISEGTYIGTVIEDNLNIYFLNATQKQMQAQMIAQGTLKRICNICSVVYPPDDLENIKGKDLMITIKNKEYISNTSGKTLTSNNIIKYDFVSTPRQDTDNKNSNMDWD
jgi:hypothetical protein